MEESKTKMHGSNCWYSQIAQKTQRRCRNIVTTSDDWLYRRFQFVGKETFADVTDKVVATLKSDVVTT